MPSSYNFPLKEAMTGIRDYLKSELTALGETIPAIPYTFTLLGYPFNENNLPLTVIEWEKFPARRGGKDLANASDYAFNLQFTLWRFVARTGTTIAEEEEVDLLAQLSETLASDFRWAKYNGDLGGMFNDSVVRCIEMGDDAKANAAIDLAGLAGSIGAVGLGITVEMVCPRILS